MQSPLRIGLIGWGTVGSAFGDLVGRGPLRARVTRLAVRTPRDRLPAVPICSASELVEAADVDVVVELAGGMDALGWARTTLAAGRPYVTANKALLAAHGGVLAGLARDGGGALLASASVGGGVPMIETVRHLAATGEVVSLRGLLNATTTFVLSRMGEGRPYEAALAEAQEAGYAEADPTFDVEGRDAAQKLAILASVAWGTWRGEGEVETRGIVGVEVPAGGVVRLVAYADGDGMRVRPMELDPASVMASASGVESVLEVEVRGSGAFRVSGPGAGGSATAAAVYADLARLVAGERPILFGGPL